MDLDSPELPTLFRKTVLKGDFDPSTKLESTQVFVTSNDGTRVPMFIISPRGTLLDGSNLTLLYGYGGEIKDSDLAEREREAFLFLSLPPLTKGSDDAGCSFSLENSISHSRASRSRTPDKRIERPLEHALWR